VVQSRAGLRRIGREFIRLYPKDEKIVQVKFNIARTYYDAGEFEDSIRLFTSLVNQFPSAKEATVSAHLVLDSYRNLEDGRADLRGQALLEHERAGRTTSSGASWCRSSRAPENHLLETETLKATGESEEGRARTVSWRSPRSTRAPSSARRR